MYVQPSYVYIVLTEELISIEKDIGQLIHKSVGQVVFSRIELRRRKFHG